MFTPQGQDPTALRTVLFIFIIAMLASLCSRQMAHGETFLPAERNAAQVSLRPEVSVAGDEIRFRQVARWSDVDKTQLDPIGDLVVARFGQGKGFRGLDLAELKATLTDAGVGLGSINFVGATACRIERSDAKFAPGVALDQYTAAVTNTPATTQAQTPDAAGVRTLRRVLAEDLAGRLHLDAEDLQLTFKPEDEAVLRRAEPHDSFDVRPQRAGDLGDVSWVVSVSGEKRIFLAASARAWRKQVVANQAIAARQPIAAGDVTERRTLVDRLGPDALLATDKVVGQAAARDIKAGAVFTTQMVNAVQLVKSGQDVMVDTASGAVRLRIAARALSDGTMGQTVLLRNEQTRQQFHAVVTGPRTVSLATNGLAGSVR